MQPPNPSGAATSVPRPALPATVVRSGAPTAATRPAAAPAQLSRLEKMIVVAPFMPCTGKVLKDGVVRLLIY